MLRRSQLLFHAILASAISVGAITAQTPTEQRISRIQNAIVPPVITKGQPPATTKLADRMAELHVPA